MKQMIKRVLALGLVLCSLLPLLSASAQGASYTFPKIGDTVELGEPLSSSIVALEYSEKINYQGKDYLLVPVQGGKLYVFRMSDCINNPSSTESWIYDTESTGIGVPRNIVVNSQGIAYVIGDAYHVFVYDIKTKTGRKLDLPIKFPFCRGLTIDENDNIYITARPDKPADPAWIIKVTPDDKASVLYTNKDIYEYSSCAYGDGYVYTWGAYRDNRAGGELHKINVKTGKKEEYTVFTKSADSYYMSYVDGVVFAGHSTTLGEGMVAVDTATMKRIDIGTKNALKGVVTNPYKGKSYMITSEDGLLEYDLATRKVTPVKNVKGGGLLSVRNAHLTADPNKICTFSHGGSTLYVIDLKRGETNGYPQISEGASSHFSARSMTTGIPGTGTTVYIGGYLTPKVASYTPYTENPVNTQLFHNGYAQTDSLCVYNGKLYGGFYNGAYLGEYNPITNQLTYVVNGMDGSHGQIRIHAIVGGDNKVFFTTVPHTGFVGGLVCYYDLITKETVVLGELIDDQVVISLVYDEQNKLLYGASTILGGAGTTPTKKEAMMMVYDMEAKKHLGNFYVDSGKNKDSDMVFNTKQGDKLPEFISGIAQDPYTGKLWGLVSRTLFSFRYNKTTGTFAIHQEWAPAENDKNIYDLGGSVQYFNRPICFDGKGYLYAMIDSEGVRQFKLDNLGENRIVAKDSSRVYILGKDGNLYFMHSAKLKMVTLSRVTMTEQLIEKAGSAASIQRARQAYDTLTAEEKKAVNRDLYNRLLKLEGREQITDTAVQLVEEKIDAIGTINGDSELLIHLARTAYDALSDSQKAKVRNYSILQAAENDYAAYIKALMDNGKEAADNATVTAVIQKISEIGEVTKESKYSITLARLAYDALSQEQKEKVTNAEMLFAAEKALEQLLPDSGMAQNTVQVVEQQIDAIGQVTFGSRQSIEAARKAYDALTEEQKAQVNNADVLFAAEEAFTNLKPGSNAGTVILTIVITLVVLAAGGAAAWYFLIYKKKETQNVPAE